MVDIADYERADQVTYADVIALGRFVTARLQSSIHDLDARRLAIGMWREAGALAGSLRYACEMRDQGMAEQHREIVDLEFLIQREWRRLVWIAQLWDDHPDFMADRWRPVPYTGHTRETEMEQLEVLLLAERHETAQLQSEPCLPHYEYVETVAGALREATHDPYPTVEVLTCDERGGLRSAICRFRPATDASDDEYLAWPRGMGLLWDHRMGWRCAELLDGGVAPETECPLPIPAMASPDAVVALLPALLDGRLDHLPASGDQWPFADELLTRIADLAPEAGTR